MTNLKWSIILLNLVLLLGYFNYAVSKKERLLKDGTLVLLELAPVDPRSLMQGDYMDLRYKIAEGTGDTLKIAKRGFVVVQLDSNGIANRLRFQEAPSPKNEGEQLIKYTAPNQWTANIGAESFFFQEGQGEKFEKAKFGGLKIDNEGNSLLIGLYDEGKRKIE